MKSKINSIIFLFFLVIACFTVIEGGETGCPGERAWDSYYAPASSQIQAEFYVSPAGDDANNGSLGYPFKTISKAQEVVRANISSGMTGDAIVYLMNGTYRIPDTLHFNQSDNGRDGHAVVYKAITGHAPVIDGGHAIPSTSWMPYEGNIWRCAPNTGDFRQLYVVTGDGEEHNTPNPNASPVDSYPHAGEPTSLSVMTPSYDGSGKWERRAIRAREAVPENTFTLEGDGHGYKVSTGFWSDIGNWKIPNGEKISDKSWYAKDLEFVYHMLWNLRRIPVHTLTDYDGEKRVIMAQPAFHFARQQGYGTNLGKWPDKNQPDWIENAYELLDEPGEWYYDRFTGWLYYMPLDGEPAPNSTSIEFIIPKVETLLDINGSATDPVEYLRFEGITFKHSLWLRPQHHSSGFVDWQANVIYNMENGERIAERSPGAVVVSYTNNITIERCVFTKLGSAGLDFYIGCQNSTVQGSTFDDISGTGINIGDFTPIYNNSLPEVPRNNSVLNYYLTNIAVEYKGGHAVWTGYTNSCMIEHNEISGTAYSAMGLGWGWSDAQTICGNNSIQYNHITNYMMELQDGAAIYMLSLQNDTKVQYNHIHDGAGSGLYPDHHVWMTTWRYNVVYRSGNSLQDHTLGDLSSDTSINENVITDNYFDMFPIIEPDRQAPHIPTNIWNIGREPNATVLAIVADAGLEPAYSDLLAGNETIREYPGGYLYWSDIPEQLANPLDPVLFWIFGGSIAAIAAIGVFNIRRKKYKHRGEA